MALQLHVTFGDLTVAAFPRAGEGLDADDPASTLAGEGFGPRRIRRPTTRHRGR